MSSLLVLGASICLGFTQFSKAAASLKNWLQSLSEDF